MTLSDALILGLVQGIAEFLPISSTGHLILAREVLGLQTNTGLAVDAMLHFATALAVIIYFRKDLLSLVQSAFAYIRGKTVAHSDKVLLFALALGTIPAVVAGLLLEDTMSTLFRSAELVAWVLIAGSILFLVAEYVHKQSQAPQELTVRKGLVVGLFQALALIPGMSRSGATIAGGMLLGLSRESAARFAFLLSVPIILGAGSKKTLELGGAHIPGDELVLIAVAAFIAFVTGMLAIHYLIRFLKQHSLLAFVVYRVALAIFVLLLV